MGDISFFDGKMSWQEDFQRNDWKDVESIILIFTYWITAYLKKAETVAEISSNTNQEKTIDNRSYLSPEAENLRWFVYPHEAFIDEMSDCSTKEDVIQKLKEKSFISYLMS